MSESAYYTRRRKKLLAAEKKQQEKKVRERTLHKANTMAERNKDFVSGDEDQSDPSLNLDDSEELFTLESEDATESDPIDSASASFPQWNYEDNDEESISIQGSTHLVCSPTIRLPIIKKKKRQPKRAWSWNCVQLIDADKKIYQCAKCSKQFDLTTVTISNVKSHIANNHYDLFLEHTERDTPIPKMDKRTFNVKTMEWVLRRNHPFSIVEESELIQLLKNTPSKRNTLVKYIPEIRENYFSQVCKIF